MQQSTRIFFVAHPLFDHQQEQYQIDLNILVNLFRAVN